MRTKMATLAGLALALCAGVIIGAVVASSQNATAETAIVAERTCYVDFIKLLKEDEVLLSEQIEIESEILRQINKKTAELGKEFDTKNKERAGIDRTGKDAHKYDALTRELIKLKTEMEKFKIFKQMDMQVDVSNAAKRRFEKLRNYAHEIAKGRGATQVLVISTSSSKDLSFDDIQKQLMLSPVLMYTSAYDITEDVRKLAQKDRVNFECDDVTAIDASGKPIAKMEKDAKDAAPDKRKNPDNLDYEIDLKGKLILRGMFSDLNRTVDKREPVSLETVVGDKRVNPVWDLRGYGVGTYNPLPNGDCEYIAPDTMPSGAPATGAIVEINVGPEKARSKDKTLRIRLKPNK